jgi:Cdc6-like AAA superfamily ATPase
MSNRITEGNRGLVKLDFSHLPLYGRFQEKLSIVNSLSRVGVAGASAEVLVLYGKSGTGKTALVMEALNDFEDVIFEAGEISSQTVYRVDHLLRSLPSSQS